MDAIDQAIDSIPPASATAPATPPHDAIDAAIDAVQPGGLTQRPQDPVDAAIDAIPAAAPAPFTPGQQIPTQGFSVGTHAGIPFAAGTARPPQGGIPSMPPPPGVAASPATDALNKGTAFGEDVGPDYRPYSEDARRVANDVYNEVDRAMPGATSEQKLEAFHQGLQRRGFVTSFHQPHGAAFTDSTLLFHHPPTADPEQATRQYFVQLDKWTHPEAYPDVGAPGNLDAMQLGNTAVDAQDFDPNLMDQRRQATFQHSAEHSQQELGRDFVARSPGLKGVGESLGAIGQNVYGEAFKLAGSAAELAASSSPVTLPFLDDVEQIGDAANELGNERIAANPVDKYEGIAARGIPMVGKIAAGVAAGPAAPAVWAGLGATEMHARALDALLPEVKAGRLSAADAHRTAAIEAGWGGFIGYVTAVMPGFGQNMPLLEQVFRTAGAGASQSVAEDLVAKHYHGDAKQLTAILEDAAVASILAGLMHGVFHVYETLTGRPNHAPGARERIPEPTTAEELPFGGRPPDAQARAAAEEAFPRWVVDLATGPWEAFKAGRVTRDEAIHGQTEPGKGVELTREQRVALHRYFRAMENGPGAAPGSEPGTHGQEAPTSGASPTAPPENASQPPPAARKPRARGNRQPPPTENAGGPGSQEPAQTSTYEPAGGGAGMDAGSDGARPPVHADETPVPEPREGVTATVGGSQPPTADASSIPPDGGDPLYERAKAIVQEHNRASVSLLQRHLTIGYGQATTLIERMKSEGLVELPADGKGAGTWKGATSSTVDATSPPRQGPDVNPPIAPPAASPPVNPAESIAPDLASTEQLPLGRAGDQFTIPGTEGDVAEQQKTERFARQLRLHEPKLKPAEAEDLIRQMRGTIKEAFANGASPQKAGDDAWDVLNEHPLLAGHDAPHPLINQLLKDAQKTPKATKRGKKPTIVTETPDVEHDRRNDSSALPEQGGAATLPRPDATGAGDGVSHAVPGAEGTQPAAGQRGGQRAGDAGGQPQRPSVEPLEPDGGAGQGEGAGPVDRERHGPGSAGATDQPVRPTVTAPAGTNHVILPEHELAPRGVVGKFKANVAAIKLLKSIEAEGRHATDAEKQQLAQYTGWGWAGEHFNPAKPAFAEQHRTLKELLTDEEFRSARESTINAHYTSPDVIRPMWDLVRRLGFSGGRVLEPGMGIGHFFGLMPQELAGKSTLTGVELDKLSARIGRVLYGAADVRNEGYQDTRLANNSQDLTISNVPFDDGIVGAKDHPHANLHDYYFLRSIDKTKPGGLIVFITSDGTLDKLDSSVRAKMAEGADLVGAIRLPNNAFQANAGTEVTTDVVVLRKKDGSGFEGEQFVNLAPTGEEGSYKVKENGTERTETKPIRVNEYFVEHPQNVLGQHTLAGTMYGRGDYATVARPGQDTAALLRAAIARFPADVFGKAPPADLTEQAGTEANRGEKELSYVEREGQLYQVRDGKLAEPDWLNHKGFGKDPDEKISPATAADRVDVARDWIKLRDTIVRLFTAENAEATKPAELVTQRKELNQRYDAYRKRYGSLGKRFAHTEKARFMADDPEYALVQAVEQRHESIDPQSGKEVITFAKGDIFRKRIRTPRSMPKQASSIDDGMKISMGYRNELQPELIAQLTGATPDAVIKHVVDSGRGFVNPKSGLLETRERYLSGNVRTKLDEAKAAAGDDAQYKPNVAALENVQPAWLPLPKITFQLSAHWIPEPVLESFAADVLKAGTATIHYVQQTNAYTVHVTNGQSPEIQTTYGTKDLDGVDLLRLALNGDPARVTRTTSEGGKKVTYVDMEATMAAATKLEELKRQFVTWAKAAEGEVRHQGQHKSIGQAMEDAFNYANNSVVPPAYSGEHLELPGLTNVKLRPHQSAAVARGLSERAMVLAHGVGSGKTYALIVLAQELKRIGLSKKTLIAVQKATVGQFAASYRKAYPDARVLVADEKSFSKGNRQRFLARAAMGEWDAIVLTQPQYERLENDPRTVVEYINRQLDALAEAMQAADGDSNTTKQLVKAEKRLKKRLEKALEGLKGRQDNAFYFEQMGVDMLLIDEAHAYKRIPIITRKQNVKGIPSDNSERAVGMELKAQHVQEKNGGGRGVILATGTPITNSMAEAFVMLRLAAPHVLAEYGIHNFDDFANTFGEAQEKMEFTAFGRWKLVTRFNRFTNGRALGTMIRSAFDVKIGNKELGIPVPELKGGKPELVIAPHNENMARLNQWIMSIGNAFEAMPAKERRERSWIPIVTMGAGMAGALDPRLVDPSMSDAPDSKLNIAVGRILEIYNRTTRATDKTVEKGVQLVFADRFAPMNTDKLEAVLGGRPGDIVMEDEQEEAAPAAASDDDDEDDVDVEAKARAAAEDAEYKNARFNVYHELRDKLVKAGVPRDAIAIIHDYPTDKKRERLFERVNAGDVRVLIGSTERMGVGVNVQTRMVAIHHLDPPRMMTPAMLEQRNGRGIRQGNLNAEIHILNYGVEKSLDTGIYQMLENKQRMLVQALKGAAGDDFEDPADEVSMSMGEIKGRLTGDDRAIRREELTQRIRKLEMEQSGHDNERYSRIRELEETRRRTKNYRNQHIPEEEKQLAAVAKAFPGGEEQTWHGKFGADEASSREDLAKMLEQMITDLRHRAANSENRLTEGRRGTVNGMDVAFAATRNGDPGKEADVSITAYLRHDNDIVQQGSVSTGAGTLTSLSSSPRRAKERLEADRRTVAELERNVPALEAAIAKPWEKAELLNKMRDEKAAIEASLMADGTAAAAAGKVQGSVQFRARPRTGFIALPELSGVKELLTHLVDSARRYGGSIFPTITRLSPVAGDRAAQVMGSKAYSIEAPPVIGEWIITGGRPMPRKEIKELRRLVGAVLVQDNLDELRDKAEDPDEVHDLIGAPDSPFRTEQDYEDAIKDPRVLDAIERHKEWFVGEAEANYRASQEIEPKTKLPPRGRVLKARINLKAILPDDPAKPVAPVHANKGNLRNPRKTTSPFARAAKGTGEVYETDLYALIQNTLARGTEPANLMRLYEALQASGLAVMGKPGQRPTLAGKATIGWDMKNRTIVLVQPPDPDTGEQADARVIARNKVLYVRADVMPELRRLVNVDDPIQSRLVRGAAGLSNRLALASLSEAFYHVSNQVSAMLSAPGTGFVVPTLARKLVKLIFHDPATRQQLVELARIGALREHEPKNMKNPLNWMGAVIEFTDRVGRLALDDAYQGLVRRRIVKPTAANRRNFVNRFGQYNKRAQHWLIHMARETGLGPFATAASNFYVQGVRNATLNPGVEATSNVNALRLRGMMLARFALVMAFAWVYNLLRHGRGDGALNVPVGAIYLGAAKDGRVRYVDLLNLIGLKRGLRALGVAGAIEEKRKGASNHQAFDQGFGDALEAMTRPFTGPIVQFGFVAGTGHDAQGYQVAKKVDTEKHSQKLANLKAAALHANPLVDLAAGGRNNQFGNFAPKEGGRADDTQATVLDRRLHRAMREGMNDDQLADFKRRQDLLKAMRANPDNAYDLLSAEVLAGRMTNAQAKALDHRRKRSELADSIDQLSDDKAMRVWDAATQAEREQMYETLLKKIARSTSIDDAKKEAYTRHVQGTDKVKN